MDLIDQLKGEKGKELLDIICSMIENDTSGRIYLDYASGSKIRVSKKQVPEQVISKDLPLVKT